MEILTWIFDWPDWLLETMVIVVTIILFLAGWMGYLTWVEPHTRQGRMRRRFHGWIDPHYQSRRSKPWPVAVAGALAGALLALTLAEPWQAFMVDRLTQLPPTAAGRVSPEPADAADLLP